MKGRVTFNWARKALLTAIVSLGLLTTNSFAQVQWHLGPTIGPQLTNLQSDLGKFKGIIGFNAGVSTDLRLGNMFSIGLEELYATNGATKTYNQDVVGSDRTNYYTYKTTDKFTYLKSNLLFKFILPLGSKPIIPYDKPGDQKLFISLFAGPYYAQRIGFSSKGTKSGYTALNNGDTVDKFTPIAYATTSIDNKKVAGNDIGVMGGAGINFNLNGGKAILGFEGTYSRSLLTLDLGYYQKQTRGTNANGQNIVIKQYAQIFNTAMAFNVSLKFRLLGGE
jgi:hypothetical protein